MIINSHFLSALFLIIQIICGLNGEKSPVDKLDNRELLEYLMQASSQMPPSYLYNSASEENQLELPTTSSSNLSVQSDENATSYQAHYLNHLNQFNKQYQSNPINHSNLNVTSRSVNLTRFINNEDDDNLMINQPMQNKQAKSADYTPLSYLHHHHPQQNLAPVSKLYRMNGGRGLDSVGWRREPFTARTVSSLFGRPRKNGLSDLMKSAADIPTPSASYYTTDSELEDPAQISASLAKSAAMRSYPLYHQASNYGQYYAEDPRQAHYYHQMRDYYDPHGHDMAAYSKSDFYWLIPIAFLIGAGALLLPIISVFMTTLVTSGTLTLNAGRRRKRDVDFLVGELRHLIGEDAYSKLEDLYAKVQRSIDKFGNSKDDKGQKKD